MHTPTALTALLKKSGTKVEKVQPGLRQQTSLLGNTDNAGPVGMLKLHLMHLNLKAKAAFLGDLFTVVLKMYRDNVLCTRTMGKMAAEIVVVDRLRWIVPATPAQRWAAGS